MAVIKNFHKLFGQTNNSCYFYTNIKMILKMEKEIHYVTNYTVWKEEVAFDYFSDKISIENMHALIDHICKDGVAQEILSVAEIDGVLELNLGTSNILKIERDGNN